MDSAGSCPEDKARNEDALLREGLPPTLCISIYKAKRNCGENRAKLLIIVLNRLGLRLEQAIAVTNGRHRIGIFSSEVVS